MDTTRTGLPVMMARTMGAPACTALNVVRFGRELGRREKSCEEWGEEEVIKAVRGTKAWKRYYHSGTRVA